MSQPYIAKPFQTIGTEFLLEHLRCNLWSHMGLGKTATCLAMVDILKLCGSSFFPVLVIAPKRVCELVWPAEILKWREFNDLTISLVLGDRKEREDALLVRADIFVINYDNIQWLIEHIGNPDKWPFRIVIADESTRLKSFRLKQGGARAHALSLIAKQVGRWINLTGTPSPNGLRDLWGQVWFVDFGERLGHSYTDFMKRWFRTDPYTKAIEPLPFAEAEIHAILADCTLALRAEDWLNIHELVITDVPVRLPPGAQYLYDEMEKQFFIEIGAIGIEAVNAMAKSQKLLQMCNGSIYDAQSVPHQIHDAKIEGLKSVVEDMGGEPIIVTYFYRFDIPMIQKAFPKARVFKDKRDEEDWNAGRIQMLLLHPQSAAHGVNLQDGGRCMVFFAHMWDLELRLQAIERIGPTRQAQSGHNRAVLIYNLVAQNTMDEVVLERLGSKKSVQDALMAARARRRIA